MTKQICPLSKIECDSLQEMYFIWWLEDLKKQGYIKEYKRSKTYELFEKEFYRFKGIKNEKLKLLLQGHEYTPDFVILWNEKAEHLFYCYHNNVTIVNCHFIIVNQHPVSIVEIKGILNQKHDKNGSLAKFSVNRKWMFQNRNIYVELIEIQKLFIQTFTPSRYLITDKGLTKRKINWKIRSINDFVNIKKNAV